MTSNQPPPKKHDPRQLVDKEVRRTRGEVPAPHGGFGFASPLPWNEPEESHDVLEQELSSMLSQVESLRLNIERLLAVIRAEDDDGQ